MNFSKIILYGHKLHSHTYSYINYGFLKAFKALGYDTYWIDDADDVSNMNFDNSLFITECQVEKNIPLSKTSKYISHTTGISYTSRDGEHKYSTGHQLLPQHTYESNLNIDVFYLNSIIGADRINNYTYFNSTSKTLIQPWATDLLPDEFDFDTAILPRKSEAYFFGTAVNSGWNYNIEELNEFDIVCKSKNIYFDYSGMYTRGPNRTVAEPISTEYILEHMKRARIAPIIQNKDQIDSGYLTDRLFKNISYGHYCITNSLPIYDVLSEFIDHMICDTPANMIDRLFELENKDINKKILLNQMKYIKENHTYINRVNMILKHL